MMRKTDNNYYHFCMIQSKKKKEISNYWLNRNEIVNSEKEGKKRKQCVIIK